MKDLAIAIEIGSPKSTLPLVKGTFESIQRNIGNCDWKIFLLLGEHITPDVVSYVEDFMKRYPQLVEYLGKKEVSWASFINEAIVRSKEYRYFIKSHDDIELVTPDFFENAERILKNIGKSVGWISFTDIGWKTDGYYSPSVRHGFHIDELENNVFNTMQIHQFHKFPPKWALAKWWIHYGYKVVEKIFKKHGWTPLKYPYSKRRIGKYELDMPIAPVKCHAPFNHFVMIERKVLDHIGLCEDWGTPNALLVDEDWGLRALQLNYPNIWIPDMEYVHKRASVAGDTRSGENIQIYAFSTAAKFYHKWGFIEGRTPEEMKLIKEKYSDTLIVWSINRNSFDWDYDI